MDEQVYFGNLLVAVVGALLLIVFRAGVDYARQHSV
jgi:hypothetical protein